MSAGGAKSDRHSGATTGCHGHTDVIRSAQARGVAEPWTSPGFLDEIVQLQSQRQSKVEDTHQGRRLFDRSPLCTLALAEYLGLPTTPALQREVDRVVEQEIYERDVFLVRPLGFITRTKARRISYEDSLRFEHIHEEVYQRLGFMLVPVLSGPVAERAGVVQHALQDLPTQDAAASQGA